jgi:hypothetical protein
MYITSPKGLLIRRIRRENQEGKNKKGRMRKDE